MIKIEYDDYVKLLRRCDSHYSVILSCNNKRRIFPPTGKGFTHEEDRDYLNPDRFTFLRKIMELVCRENWKGGRFKLTPEGVFLKRSGKQLDKVLILNEPEDTVLKPWGIIDTNLLF